MRGTASHAARLPVVPPEMRRSLPVTPLIADQRCYGEAPAGLLTYPQDWLVCGT
jgi:hypothetical protein